MNGDKPDGDGAGGGRHQAWLTAWHDRVAGLKVPPPRAPPALPSPGPRREQGACLGFPEGRDGGGGQLRLLLLLLLLLLGSCPQPAARCPRPEDSATTSTSASPGGPHTKHRTRGAARPGGLTAPGGLRRPPPAGDVGMH